MPFCFKVSLESQNQDVDLVKLYKLSWKITPNWLPESSVLNRPAKGQVLKSGKKKHIAECVQYDPMFPIAAKAKLRALALKRMRNRNVIITMILSKDMPEYMQFWSIRYCSKCDKFWIEWTRQRWLKKKYEMVSGEGITFLYYVMLPGITSNSAKDFTMLLRKLL